MGEIKFRQWVKNTKCFHYWGKIKEGVFVSPLGGMDNDRRESMQFTGLKDKNGKEIYEGDIARYGNEKSDIIFEVKWDTDKNGWNFSIDDVMDYDEGILRYEVIGNKFENLELLK